MIMRDGGVGASAGDRVRRRCRWKRWRRNSSGFWVTAISSGRCFRHFSRVGSGEKRTMATPSRTLGGADAGKVRWGSSSAAGSDRIGAGHRLAPPAASMRRAASSTADALSTTTGQATGSARASGRRLDGGDLFEAFRGQRCRACRRSMNNDSQPVLRWMAKDSASVCAASRPRMLKAQAMESGRVSTAASAPAFRSPPARRN